ncbi:MAG: bifunctional diaminohydroxyphosphoribosylaminopyrimidine deaminase/5-amino-6-(5-phosphoribosylamino)uracil reductase RibD [Ferruginibacter sp.]
MVANEIYMHRCFELASLGEGKVAPNPMVGAVLVYNDRIIGEGYHMQYGQAHAEVNCINSVGEQDKHLVERSTLFVSLEPCAHFGKTPPCADFVIKNKIPFVVIACRDSYEEVDGKGIEKLRAAGIKVVLPILEKEGMELNRRFFTFHKKQRPYIILKWAETADKKIAGNGPSRLLISNEITNREVHKWRSQEAAILVGTNTALRDNPALTTRLWPGTDPVRMVIDKELKLPSTSHLLDGSVKTILFNSLRHEDTGGLFYYKILTQGEFIKQMISAAYQLQIQSILVEGGARLLQSFLDGNYWDEARILRNSELEITEGLASPTLFDAEKSGSQAILNDTISYYRPASK